MELTRWKILYMELGVKWPICFNLIMAIIVWCPLLLWFHGVQPWKMCLHVENMFNVGWLMGVLSKRYFTKQHGRAFLLATVFRGTTVEPKAWYTGDLCSTTKLQPRPCFFLLSKLISGYQKTHDWSSICVFHTHIVIFKWICHKM